MPVRDKLDKRMKEYYENISKTKLMRRCPVAIRIDGKAFHTFTRGFKKPFDEILIKSMQQTMLYLCENIQGCVLGYTQSDEITLILQDYKTLTTDAWFGYEVQKICSVSASMATMAFNKFFRQNVCPDNSLSSVNSENCESISAACLNAIKKGAMFDARCFNIPKEEVTNLLYWRQLDAIRNSVQGVGQAYFSHKEIQNKSCSDIQDMLMEKYNINWNDLPTTLKRGSCAVKITIQNQNVDIEDDIDLCEVWCIDDNIPIFKDEGRDYIEKRINF